MSRVPRIRFKGFKEDWEQRKLGEYLIQYTEVTIINDQYPVLTSSRKGIFFQKDYYDGNQIASENNIGYNIVPYGYFTYRHMSDDEIFYFNINNIIDNGIVSTLYPVFTTNNRLDSKFLQYELNFGKEFRKYSVLQKQGGSRTYMYFNKLRDLKLTITTSLKEQECIRNLICSIDHLITLHQSKSFEYIFKAIVNCTLYWEQRKLGVIVGIYDGVHQTPKYQDNGIMFLSVENIATLQSTKYISEDDFKRDYKVYPQENDILMTRIGDVGTTNVIADKGLKAYYVSLALLKYKSTNPYFLSNAIQSEYVKKELANRTLKTAIPMKINKDEIGKVDVMLPILVREQTKIGEYFRNLDHLITLHQLEPYKLIFKAIAYRIIDYAKSKPPRCIK